MIYFLAEFCLNSLNGTFFESVKKLTEKTTQHTKIAPWVSIYILTIGFNTLNVSVILSQILFLYHLFHSFDSGFIDLVKRLVAGLKPDARDAILQPVSSVPLVPIYIALILNLAYISDLNKCNSLLSRILYTLSSHITSIFFEEFILVKICEFAFGFAVNSLFLKFYLMAQLKTSAMIFAFSGTYFLLKTYTNLPLIGRFATKRHSFSIQLWEMPSIEQIQSWMLFCGIFCFSFFSQMLIRYFILKYVRKRKLE